MRISASAKLHRAPLELCIHVPALSSVICPHVQMENMAGYDSDFGPYVEGEDEIAGTYDTPDEFEAAMRRWVKGK